MQGQPRNSEKSGSLVVAYLLWFIFGFLGVHHIYLGRGILIWFLSIITFQGLGIWWIVDFFLIPSSLNKSRKATLREAMGIMFGCLLVGFSVANVGFGKVAPIFITGADNMKMNISEMFLPHCSTPTIAADLANGDPSACLGAVGSWDGLDLLFLCLGLFVLVSGRIGFLKIGRRSERRYHVIFGVGAALFSIAILDRLSFLPRSASSEGVTELIPFYINPFLFQCIIAAIGAFLMGGPKYWEAEAIEQTRDRLEKRRQVAGDFRDAFGSVKMSLNSRSGSTQRIARSQLLKKDSQLHMRRDTSKSIKVLATCPYCKGGGCNECGQSGTL
jgi:TM2 domain-containing membrane protein YozV